MLHQLVRVTHLALALAAASSCGASENAPLVRPLYRPATEPLPKLPVPAPSSSQRIAAGALISPASGKPGDSLRVFVKMRMAPGFHIYAMEKSGLASQATTLELSLPACLKAKGPWRGPEPTSNEDGSRTFKGEVVFDRELTVLSPPDQADVKVRIQVQYQVCSEALCWPPSTIRLETPLQVVLSKE